MFKRARERNKFFTENQIWVKMLLYVPFAPKVKMGRRFMPKPMVEQRYGQVLIFQLNHLKIKLIFKDLVSMGIPQWADGTLSPLTSWGGGGSHGILSDFNTY